MTVFDNLSRAGAAQNLEWLKSSHGSALHFIRGDVRDPEAVRRAAGSSDAIFHTAAQVAVTTSVQDPRSDFEVNAGGTLNVLEAARASGRRPVLLLTSTNKVYGSIDDGQVVEEDTHYRLRALSDGVDESQTLDFRSPYGCSKGAADQYVLDYARLYDLKTIVFRMSCIYGPRQFGNEDQGWLAHFVIAGVNGRALKIYGDGKQVRDVLYIEDLVRAMRLAVSMPQLTAGQAYNIGGGVTNAISIWCQFKQMLEDELGRRIEAVQFGDWRPGDQKVYISDIRKACRDLGWRPEVSVRDGLGRLIAWVMANRSLFT